MEMISEVRILISVCIYLQVCVFCLDSMQLFNVFLISMYSRLKEMRLEQSKLDASADITRLINPSGSSSKVAQGLSTVHQLAPETIALIVGTQSAHSLACPFMPASTLHSDTVQTFLQNERVHCCVLYQRPMLIEDIKGSARIAVTLYGT